MGVLEPGSVVVIAEVAKLGSTSAQRLRFEHEYITGGWVSCVTAQGRPLLAITTVVNSNRAVSAPRAIGGTKLSRIESRLLERDEHMSEEGLAICNQTLAEVDNRLWRHVSLPLIARRIALQYGYSRNSDTRALFSGQT